MPLPFQELKKCSDSKIAESGKKESKQQRPSSSLGRLLLKRDQQREIRLSVSFAPRKTRGVYKIKGQDSYYFQQYTQRS